jgi:hypothetical protein
MDDLNVADTVGSGFPRQRQQPLQNRPSMVAGDISPVGVVQADLLEPVTTSDTKLMRAIDGLNSRFGRGTIKLSTGEF